MTTLYDALNAQSWIAIERLEDYYTRANEFEIIKDFSWRSTTFILLDITQPLGLDLAKIYIHLRCGDWYVSDRLITPAEQVLLANRRRIYTTFSRKPTRITAPTSSAGAHLICPEGSSYIPLTRYSAGHVRLITTHL